MSVKTARGSFKMYKTLFLKELATRVGLTDILTYRPTAKNMHDIALKELGPLLPDNIVNCCFQGIETCDVSFADEFVINLQKNILQVDNTLMILSEVNEDTLASIQGALSFRNEKDHTHMNLLCHRDQVYSILGNLERNLLDTFDLVKSYTEITAREVAKQFNVEINNASNKLKKLYDAHLLLRRESIDENGRQHVYYLPE